MSSVDERVVKMRFDNETFKKKAMETKQSLSDVNKAVDAAGKGKGLMDLNSNMQKVGVTASKMAIVTTTALATIANKVTNVGINMAKALTFDPIRQGFSEYESLLTKQNVIMNATGRSGKFVKSILNDLNKYSDQTIYSFGNMTDAITKFVNAGVPLKQSVTTIKGIANAAAFAGASSEEANRAMYAFSQSMSLGFVGLQDWMQIENANMGTIRFKNELLKAAVAAGTLTKKGNEFVTASGKTISATKGWRDGLQEQWATTEVLNKALGKYADTNTKLGKQAFAAAQDVRTFSAFMDTLKESLGSGWSSIFTSLIGNLEESTEMWTNLSQNVGHAVESVFSFGATTLKTWRDMGGFEKTMEGFSNVMAPFGAILRTVGKAWRDAFPNTSSGAGKALYGLSAGFAAVTSPLQLLANLIEGTAPILKTFFQIIRIGGTIVGNAVGYVVDFAGALLGLAEIKAPTTGGLIKFAKDLAKAIADAVDEISDLLSKGKSLTEAFGSVDIKLPNMPSLPSMPKLGNLFGGDSGGGDKQVAQVGKLTAATKSLTKSVFGVKYASSEVERTALFNKGGEAATEGMENVGSVAQEFGTDMMSAGETVVDTGSKIGGVLKNLTARFLDFAENFSFTTLVKSFNMALLATFAISAARLFNTFSKGFKGFMGIGDGIQDVLGSASGALKSFQTAARAKLILAIAAAMLALAVSLWILSKIPADDLAKALLAMGAAFFMLDRGVKSLTGLFNAMKDNGLSAAINMFTISVAMVSLAVAMLMLAGAMLLMNKVEWESIAKGLVVMIAMMKVLERLSTTVDGIKWAALLAAGFAMVGMAVAMTILAGALMLFALVKWESMKKAGAALAGITLALGGLVALTKGPWGAAAMAAAGAGFAMAAVGMIALANALILFAFVKWESIKKAGVALGGLAVGLTLMTVGALGGPGMLLASIGMNALAVALMLFAKVDYSSIGKMVVAMGALALGLLVLTPILYLAAPALLLFGIAVAALGVGLFAFFSAMALAVTISGVAAVAFAALAVAAVTAITLFLQNLALQAPVMKESILVILQTAIDTVVEATPMIIQGFKDLWEAVKKEIGSEEKKKDMETEAGSWVSRAADAIEKKIPMIVRRGSDIVIAFLKGLASKAKPLAAAGVQVIIEFIKGIDQKVDGIVAAGTDLIISFIEGIGLAIPRIVAAGLLVALNMLNSLASSLEGNSGPMRDAIARCTEAMVDLGFDIIAGLAIGLAKGIADKNPVSVVIGLVGDMVEGGKKAADSHSPSRKMISLGQFMAEGLSIGVQNGAALAIQSVAAMVTGQIAMASSMINAFVQKTDQAAIAAMAKANGLAKAADIAQKNANKTKDKKDDRAADKLSKAAKEAQRKADAAEAKAQRARDALAKAEEFREASTIEKAQIRSDDAADALDQAKVYEQRAATNLAAANALDKQAKNKNLTDKQQKSLERQADILRAAARADAAKANGQVELARKYAAEAMALQKLAGEEAAALFQEQFDSEAKAAAEEEAFSKLTNEQKAIQRREQAAALQAKSEADLAKAKELAYTDLEAANDLAQIAIDEAQQARDYLKEALSYEQGTSGSTGGALGTVVDLAPTEAAAMAFNDYSNIVDSATAAASASKTIEFNQYNSSPEALSPIEVYRHTNNQLEFAVEKLDEVA